MANGTTGTTAGTTGAGLNTGTTNSLSPWVGEYVTDTLGKGQALGDTGYQAYTGALTAGTSTLQNSAMQGLASLTAPTGVGDAAKTAGSAATAAGNLTYNPTTFTSGTFDDAAAKKYMSAFDLNALQPQIDEARRQAKIDQLANSAALSKAGLWGGSSSALMELGNQRNLEARLASITGAGYKDAYDRALTQFNTEQNRAFDVDKATEQANQFGANYDLSTINKQLDAAQMQSNLSTQDLTNNLNINNALMTAGNTQRNVTQEGYDALKKQFEEERMYPWQQTEYLMNLLKGLPISSEQNAYTTPSTLSDTLSTAGTFLDLINKASPSTATTATK